MEFKIQGPFWLNNYNTTSWSTNILVAKPASLWIQIPYLP